MPIDPVLGQIMPFAGAVVPKGWVPCNGQRLAINQNQALFSLLGTQFGGDGMRTFGLPDLRGRAILGASASNPQGSINGSINITLQTSQIPQHNHVIQASTTQGAGRGSSPTNNVYGANTNSRNLFVQAGNAETALAQGTNITNSGSNQPHNNMQPYLAISYLIATQGIFPSRN
jgi:microcystin-dependent protein